MLAVGDSIVLELDDDADGVRMVRCKVTKLMSAGYVEVQELDDGQVHFVRDDSIEQTLFAGLGATA